MPSEPKTIGRYEVKRVLGHGAMGIVYLAFDPLLKRSLAIKTVRFNTDVASTLLRFQREAEISARLNHPNVVTVHDVGQDPEVGPFMAMEFVDGLPLSDLIQRGIPCESVIHLLLQGMSALQAAERVGITHRDVKPANILVSQDGRLKLMDFGIARGEGSRLTQTGQIVGTPSYTAPEALVGVEPSSVSDRYAFAVTAFQMLTCVLPFECPTIAATLFRIVHEPPLFPDSMSPELRAVFEKALDKRPGSRHPDLASFMRELIQAVDLPAETRAKFLASMTGDAGADVAHLIQTHTAESAAGLRDLPTQATPMPSRSLHRSDELATEAFWTPRPGTATLPGTGRMGPPRGPEAPPAARRRPWLAAALLALGVLGGAAAWAMHSRGFVLDVASTPSGASVFLDNRQLGRTDLAQVRFPPAGGTLRLELEGYEPQERRVRPGDGPVRISLARPPFTVWVVTDPPGAQVFLNGAARGSTPLNDLQVPGDGRQELVLRLRGHQDWAQVLDRDMPLPEVIRLEPRKGAARAHAAAPVATAPAGSPPPKPEPLPAAVPAPVVQKAPERPPAPKPAPPVVKDDSFTNDRTRH